MLPPVSSTILLLLSSALHLILAGAANVNSIHADKVPYRFPAQPRSRSQRDASSLSRRQAVPPQCGPAGGNRRCPNNLCCSDYGYCGEDPDYCDMRWCQVQFGRCGDAPPPPSPPSLTLTLTTSSTSMATTTSTAGGTSATSTATSPPAPTGTLVTSINGQCGNSTTCSGSAFGGCCSEYYFCGSGAAYCGAGCRGTFGTCANGSVSLPPPSISSTTATRASSSSSTQPSSSSSTAVPRPSNASTNGRCGSEAGRLTCTGTNFGPCCSIYGYCGDGADYCTPLYCQADYGRCGG